jgi:hypothetical protein
VPSLRRRGLERRYDMAVVPIIGTTQIDLSPIEDLGLSGHYRAESTTVGRNRPEVRVQAPRATDGLIG